MAVGDARMHPEGRTAHVEDVEKSALDTTTAPKRHSNETTWRNYKHPPLELGMLL